MSEDQKLLELSDFADLVGETFVFSLDGVEETAEAVLSIARLIESGTAPGCERKPFELEFRFPVEANLGQCVFNVRTAKGREFPPQFLVPCGADEEGWHMLCTIN